MNMLKIVAGGIVTAAVAGAGLFLGAGSAGAVPDVIDRAYSDAKNMIQEAGGNPVVATRTGAGLEESDCLVTNAWEAGYPNVSARGRIVGNNEVLVALNCNGELAGAGTSGNSAASPVGREAKTQAEQEAAEQEEQELAEAATPNE